MIRLPLTAVQVAALSAALVIALVVMGTAAPPAQAQTQTETQAETAAPAAAPTAAPVDLDRQAAFIADEESAAADLRGAFEQAAAADLETLQRSLGERREKVDAALARLREEQAALQSRLPASPSAGPTAGADNADMDSAGDGPAGGAAGDDGGGAGASQMSDAEAAARLKDEQRLAALNDAIDRAELVRRDYDGLMAHVAEAAMRASLQQAVDERRADIEAAGRRLEEAADEAALIALREELRALRDAGAEAIAPLKTSRERLQADLERLGPPPAEGEAEESREIAEERDKLRGALAIEDGIIRQADLNAADVNRLLADISRRRRDQFYSQILTRGPTPLNGSLIGPAARSASDAFAAIADSARDWRATKTASGALARAYAHIGVSLFVGFLLFVPARRWANRRILDRLQRLEPTPGRRAWAALLRIFARAAPGVAAGLIVMAALGAQSVVDERTSALARAVWFGLVGLLTAEAAATAILSPSVSGWRLMPLDKRCGQAVKAIFLAFVFLFFTDRVASAGTAVFGGGQELPRLQSALIAVSMGVLIVLLSRRQLWSLDDHRKDAFSDDAKTFARMIRKGALVVGVLIIAATLYGYVALGYFAATRAFMLGGLLLLGLFVRLIVQEALRTLDQTLSGRKSRPEDETDNERLIFFWIGAFVDLLIVLALLPPAAMALGAEWVDVRDMATNAFFGFKVGNFTISLAQVLGAISLFAAILAVTRFIQRTGEKRFFPRTRLDVGVQNSLKTLIGYVGLVIAIMASVSVLGFNLSNLAIIAGALSVGIGFGLQSIVNNFVSGLILLFERPIKVGDWIVVSSGEGTVKRISVRSTEIETWDRSSIIVPNSELISSSVTNWTHKDRWTRLIIPVGVSYDSDPREVVKILEGVINANSKVMRFPEPYVFFSGFGDSSLDFELRVFLRETSDRIPMLTELRIATFEALKAAGVEIPFPQRDLHVRSAPGLSGISSAPGAAPAHEAHEAQDEPAADGDAGNPAKAAE